MIYSYINDKDITMDEYYIYLTENLLNNKKYIGKHKGKQDDDYIGSGIVLKKAIEKYGKENFKKTILEVATEVNIDELEKKWIKQFDAFNRDDFYNLTYGGDGGNTMAHLPIEEISKKRGNWYQKLSISERKKLGKKRGEFFKKINNDKKILEKRILSLKKTLSKKTIEEKKKDYENRSGQNAYQAVRVQTPLGVFCSFSEAGMHHNCTSTTIKNRCMREQEGWKIL